MRASEARWIAAQLAQFSPRALSPLLNVGSSTAEFRAVRQPHIEREVFSPLRRAGVTVVHADLKAAEGVDVVGDLHDPDVQERLRSRGFKAAIVSNLLEHVPEPQRLSRAIESLIDADGILIVTGPRSYPYHADPIDTGFRPDPAELAALFPNCRVVLGEIVEDVTYGRELVASGRKSLRRLLGALRPFGDAGRAQRDRLRWLFRPFTATCVVLQRN